MKTATQSFVIEVEVEGHRGWIDDQGTALKFTQNFSRAARYRSELEASCARVYVPLIHQPTIVQVMDPERN